MMGGKFVKSIFQLVMPDCQLAEFFVCLEQSFLQALDLPIHSPPPSMWALE
jgi:hypothetical protein